MHFSYLNIKELYRKVVWSKDQLDNQCIRIKGVNGTVFYIHAHNLGRCEEELIRLLRQLRPDMLRSRTNVGVPWQAAAICEDGLSWASLEYIEMLLAIGQAAGFVTVQEVHIDSIREPVYFAIIENLRIINKKKNLSTYMNRVLRKWK